jgi:hypothetical protein
MKLSTTELSALTKALKSPCVEGRAETFDLDGVTFTLRAPQDIDNRLEDDGDWFGSLKWVPTTSQQRPQGFDGSATIVHRSRQSKLWWLPPEDLKGDTERRESLRKRIADYYNDGWCYVGLVLTATRPCSCGEGKRRYEASIWGVESDALSTDYFDELLADLVAELEPEGN